MWANWFLDNYQYAVCDAVHIRLCIYVAASAQVEVSIFICLFTAVAFIFVGEGAEFVKRRSRFWLAVQDTKCTFGHLDNVIKNYAPNLIARQIAYKINNNSLNVPPIFCATNCARHGSCPRDQIKAKRRTNLAGDREDSPDSASILLFKKQSVLDCCAPD